MIKHGKAPFLECSSKGDKRFSAFYAKVNGRTIEDQYQNAKVFEDGTKNVGIKAAKGRAATNTTEVNKLYEDLWQQYIIENPELIDVLLCANGLSDIFGQPGHMCQATVLWTIRGEYA